MARTIGRGAVSVNCIELYESVEDAGHTCRQETTARISFFYRGLLVLLAVASYGKIANNLNGLDRWNTFGFMRMNKLPLHSLLDDAGLKMHHVFNLADLPSDLLAPLAPTKDERQLIMFGHVGRRLWDCVQSEGIKTDSPIDEYSVRTVSDWFRNAAPMAHFRFVFPIGLPNGKHAGLQRLGMLAGWHHPSPFFVGVNARFGSWYAYRAVILTNTTFPPSETQDLGNPCLNCESKPCIDACGGSALISGKMDMDACHQQRLRDNSPCALGCLARLACPAGAEYRYEDSQIRHSAKGSLAAIGRGRCI